MLTQRVRTLYLVFIGMLAVLVFTGCSVSRPKYSALALDKLETELAFGVVVEQDQRFFTMRDNWTGEVKRFETGRRTQFVPEVYRSQAGDEIRVAYTKIMKSYFGKDETPFLRRVYQIQAINVAPENELPDMPMRGKVTLIGRGAPTLHSSASFILTMSESGRTYKIDWPPFLDSTVPGGVNGLLDHTVEVWVRRIPNQVFNRYHYLAEKITIVKDEYITQNAN